MEGWASLMSWGKKLYAASDLDWSVPLTTEPPTSSWSSQVLRISIQSITIPIQIATTLRLYQSNTYWISLRTNREYILRAGPFYRIGDQGIDLVEGGRNCRLGAQRTESRKLRRTILTVDERENSCRPCDQKYGEFPASSGRPGEVARGCAGCCPSAGLAHAALPGDTWEAHGCVEMLVRERITAICSLVKC